jgi:hypothetical protein
MRPQIAGEARVFRIPFASFCMHKDRPGQRRHAKIMKWIASKKNPLFRADAKCPQAVTARTVARRNFPVRRMPVARRTHAGTNRLRDLCGYRYNLKGRHVLRLDACGEAPRKSFAGFPHIVREISSPIYPLGIVKQLAQSAAKKSRSLNAGELRAPPLCILP